MNIVLLMFTSVYGVLIVGFSFLSTLLVLIYDHQKLMLRKLSRKKETSEQKNLLKQREAAEQNFDPSDLPSIDEVKELYDR